ncbi:MAG: RNA polymerase sigma factor [Bacteroidota bacterium]
MSAANFQQNILPLQDKMYRYVLSMVFDVEFAKDIVQEVLMKLWVKRADLGKVKNLEAWCIRLTRNLTLDKLKLKHRKNVGLDELVETPIALENPANQLENQDLLQSIYTTMKDLSPQQQEIFRLRDLLGYSNKEIKELMDLNDSQVKVNLFRARQKIKLRLGKLINYGQE